MTGVFIDPGHGGYKPGAVAGGYEEEDINLAVAWFMACELRVEGLPYRMTRIDDSHVGLLDRVWMANDWNADVFLSIHCDAAERPEPKGMTVFLYKGTQVSKPLGRALADALAARFPRHRQRGIKYRSNLTVLKRTRMPAALVELGFISNPDERAFLVQPKNQIALAQALAAGVLNFFKEGSKS